MTVRSFKRLSSTATLRANWSGGPRDRAADGHGTNEIVRRARTSKPTVWRWQERYLDAGLVGLMRDKTRPSRVPPLPRETRLKVIAKTVQGNPPNATHWSRALMAEAVGISPSSVGRIWAEAATEAYLARPKLRSDVHKEGTRQQIELHLNHWLNLPLDEISMSMVIQRHRKMAEVPSAKTHVLRPNALSGHRMHIAELLPQSQWKLGYLRK